MNRRLKMRVASAMAAVSYDLMKLNKADLLYELVSCVELLEKGQYYTLFVRETGADDIARFLECVRDENNLNPTYEQALDYAQRTCGVDVALLFEMNEDKTDFIVNITNYKLDKYDLWRFTNDLEVRGVQWK